ncbi:hypothetical protein [Serratia marcescens]
MDNKLSELSKPVGFIEQSGMDYLRSGEDADIWPDGGRGDDIPLYSQEYVSALLAENERVASDLVARNGEIEGLRKRAAELEKRLATPVRLPPPTAWMRGDDKTTFGPIFTKNKEYAESQWGDSAIALYSVPVGIKEAGFSDERNLMHINERGRETSLIWNKNNSENGDIQLFRLVGFTVEGDE